MEHITQTKLRIGTWNVEYATPPKNAERLALLQAADADIWVLTETQDGLDLGASYHAACSELRQTPPARWVSIWSRHPLIKQLGVRDPIRTAAALYATPLGKLLVYGTVMPWQSDRGPSDAEPYWAEHHRVIPEQADEWKALVGRCPDAALCVAGDLNMNLGGEHYYGTARGTELLKKGLANAGLACVTHTEQMPSGKLAEPHIDHICVPEAWAQRAQVVEAWPGTIDGVRLSDHSAIVVEVRA